MLDKLSIRSLALIDALELTFDAGFSALTGETGAGKSILLSAMAFVLGERASRESIRTGANKGSVEAEFTPKPDSPVFVYLKEHELDDGDTLTLYRELSQSGRNVCRVNGTPVTAAELKAVGDLLVDLHGQHEHQSLLNPATHLGLIDAFAASDADGLVGRMGAARKQALEASAAVSKLQKGLAQREQRLDMVRFACDEIDRAALRVGEEAELNTVRERMRNAETILTGLNTAYDALYGDEGALNSLSAARSALTGIASFDADYAERKKTLDDAYYGAEDAAYGLRDAIAGFRFDPEALEEAENRLSLIGRLKKKYGADEAEILRYRAALEQERDELDGGEERLVALQQKKLEALHSFSRLANELSDRRKEAAERLSRQIVEQLGALGMPHARFSARFTPLDVNALDPNGVDAVEFYFSANRGEPEKPLAKVASGGEVSRVMLACKVALADADRIDTLIFDEIDTGISGAVAMAVARKMRELSKGHQLLCVTHLPQIAAHADAQYLVYKESSETSTTSLTRRLTEAERPAELARIMGASDNDPAALQHGAELLTHAKETV